MKIQIAHLYPENLNLYGDRGNIVSLVYRMRARGIECEVKEYNADDKIDFDNTDIIYLGGGTDKDNEFVRCKLLENKEEFLKYAESGGCILAVCGSYELLGKYIEQNGKKLCCLGLLDLYTVYSDERQIGNIVLESDITGDEVVGFENHAGIINAGDIKAFGKVIKGFGNDGKSGCEGAVYKNVIATYLHGPLLPKNPKLCDKIILNALEKKYGNVVLEELDDSFENQAHDYAVKRFS